MEILKEPVPQQRITLNQAAAILGRERKLVDTLVRREKIIPTYGKGGHHLDRDGLVMLQTALRLEELNVPRAAIKRLPALLRPHLRRKSLRN